MPALKTYDLFISHAWTYNEHYHRLVGLLNDADLFHWRNYSVPEHDPLIGGNEKKLTEELDKQIRPVNAVLVIAGMYVNFREWIQKEIDLSQKYEKPIIGIYPWGSEHMPQAVREASVTLVKWNTDPIVNAIRKHAL